MPPGRFFFRPAAAEAQLNLSLTVIACILLMAVVLISVYHTRRLKRTNERLLADRQNKIREQDLALQHLITDNHRLLNEKDWLLKEVHHRVKNNLQIVMSLLNTQSAFLKNNAALAAIRESQNRVQSIALIHQKLYSHADVAFIDIAVYINELVNHLDDCYKAREKGIRFEQLIRPVKMDVAQAIPVGLMLNEAITNAIKYAFAAGPGIIKISLETLNDDNVALSISDNGVGLPPGFDIKQTSTLGMEMMKALSRQLNGNFTIKNENGVLISLIFGIENKFGSDDNGGRR